MKERIKYNPKVDAKLIESVFETSPIIRNIVYVVLAIGVIYVAGKTSNGMASAVRGFRNLGSALKGE